MPNTHSSSTTIDFSYLKEITGGDLQVLKNLLVVLQKNLQDYPNKITEHFKQKEFKELADAAHKFKSSVAYLGHDEFTQALVVLELNQEEKTSLEEMARLIVQLKEFAAEVLASVEFELLKINTI